MKTKTRIRLMVFFMTVIFALPVVYANQLQSLSAANYVYRVEDVELADAYGNPVSKVVANGRVTNVVLRKLTNDVALTFVYVTVYDMNDRLMNLGGSAITGDEAAGETINCPVPLTFGADIDGITVKVYVWDSRFTSLAEDYTFAEKKLPLRNVGVEYEQIHSGLSGLTAPQINNVGVNVLNFVEGIYELSLSPSGCTLDTRAVKPFFFMSSEEGTFEDYTVYPDGAISAVFCADAGTGDRDVRIIIGVGDGLGQIDRRAILLKGNDN